MIGMFRSASSEVVSFGEEFEDPCSLSHARYYKKWKERQILFWLSCVLVLNGT
jgi:hypothetical protein